MVRFLQRKTGEYDMHLSEILKRVVVLARQIAAEPNAARRREIESELHDFLISLPVATIIMLTTIMYLGRGDFGTAGLLNSYEHLSDTLGTSEGAVGAMLEKAPLPDYLAEGIQTLSKNGIDVDTLLTAFSDTPLASLDDGAEVELSVGPWYCDTCGKVIARPEDGMLQWLTRRNSHRRLGRDLRIVHHLTVSPRGRPNGCYPDQRHELEVDGSILADEHLGEILGADGLVKLLSLIEDDQLPAPEVTRIIMRLFVPGYERARPYFHKAVSTGLVDPGLPQGYFFQGQLREIVANISRLQE
jgi:hypothetical protein